MNETQLTAALAALAEKNLAAVEEAQFTFENTDAAIQPIVSKGVMDQLRAGIASIRYGKTWKEWGFGTSNSVLLLSGDPGTGKTTAAKWIAKTLEKSLLSITYADIGSEKPGEDARRIRDMFAAATRRKSVIFFDEAEGMLRSRHNLSKDELWRIDGINNLMTGLEKYNGVVVLATNMPVMLDPGIARRISYRIHFSMPDQESRLRLWTALWPKWPLGKNVKGLNKLAKYELTGAEIEICIENSARKALIENREPEWADIEEACKGMKGGN